MKRKSGFNAGGRDHPEIRPGDIWKNRNGLRIIILSASPFRVEYRRIDYDQTCICPPYRFRQDFKYIKGNINETDVSRFLQAGDGKEKIRVLREIMQERLKK